MAHHPRPRRSGRLAKTDARKAANSDEKSMKKEKEAAADKAAEQANVVDSHSTVLSARCVAVREIGSITVFTMPLWRLT